MKDFIYKICLAFNRFTNKICKFKKRHKELLSLILFIFFAIGICYIYSYSPALVGFLFCSTFVLVAFIESFNFIKLAISKARQKRADKINNTLIEGGEK